MASQVKKRSAKSQGPSSKEEKETLLPSKDCGEEKPPALKFGPLGLKKQDQLWSRAVLMLGALVIVFVTKWRKTNEITWVSQQEILTKAKAQNLICSQTYFDEITKFDGCNIKQCARFVTDELFTNKEVQVLLGIFHKGLQYGHSSGGATILDLQSGALSKEDKFINIYSLPKGKTLFSNDELDAYKEAKERVKRGIAKNFGVQPEAIHLTSPTFFSEMTANPAKTVHDEYWHPHVDKETYETFHFTSLLYLSDFGNDFQGGRFVFVDGDDNNRTVEPRKGRVSMFTSGAENLHYVEKVTGGSRYALTIAFTCDAQRAIPDPRHL